MVESSDVMLAPEQCVQRAPQCLRWRTPKLSPGQPQRSAACKSVPALTRPQTGNYFTEERLMRFFLLLAASLTVTVASWLRRDRCPHERTTLSDPWACRLCGVLMP